MQVSVLSSVGRKGSVKESIIIADLQSRLTLMSEALRKAEERATAGLLALELMHEIRNPLEAVGNLTTLQRKKREMPKRSGCTCAASRNS